MYSSLHMKEYCVLLRILNVVNLKNPSFTEVYPSKRDGMSKCYIISSFNVFSFCYHFKTKWLLYAALALTLIAVVLKLYKHLRIQSKILGARRVNLGKSHAEEP
jgi:hypothetical protein